ncbi:hypothetical protein F5Y15DRAFT_19071 [Xylariaceae sp. FL0016]|nr:hypothetical protein F5Y15DRAFT_19071 [Xylariaceae sp. FL0016]
MSPQSLTQTLVDSFNALADEVQNLSDRQTILEHKLRYAHEQFQYLADKYAPSAPEIPETLVNLQVPPDLQNQSLANKNFVPLPKRKAPDSKHQLAVIIREGRRVASTLTDFSKSSRSSRSRDGSCPPTTMTSMTILEQDFTVQGKKGKLECPFSHPTEEDPKDVEGSNHHLDSSTHHLPDPICAAMNDDTSSQPAAAKCPIRYMNQHSPEEIADYVEKHKHEVPRSHEVCVRRYQKNEEHIKKLDAKYGNLVNMVEGLSRIHQPMLPEQDTRPQSDVEKGSNERVENWAKAVTATATNDPDRTDLDQDNSGGDDPDQDRQSHFDRPLKEVRVGESPSRPWGIQVPVYSDGPSSRGGPHDRPESPPPAPVPMPAPMHDEQTPVKKPGKCPFDHTKLSAMMNGTTPTKHDDKSSIRRPDVPPTSDHPFTPGQQPGISGQSASIPPQPAFLDTPGLSRSKQGNAPQMVFTGPVFIGYPVEQAIQILQQFQSHQ